MVLTITGHYSTISLKSNDITEQIENFMQRSGPSRISFKKSEFEEYQQDFSVIFKKIFYAATQKSTRKYSVFYKISKNNSVPLKAKNFAAKIFTAEKFRGFRGCSERKI